MATIHDVALRAGGVARTVSRGLDDHKSVPAQHRVRGCAARKAPDFQSNAVARHLRSGPVQSEGPLLRGPAQDLKRCLGMNVEGGDDRSACHTPDPLVSAPWAILLSLGSMADGLRPRLTMTTLSITVGVISDPEERDLGR
jgi:hypothetical protein